MKSIKIEIDIPADAHGALSNELADLLGADKYQGSSRHPNVVPVYFEVRFTDDATEADMNAARQLVLHHDTSMRDPEQVRIQQRNAYLAIARERFVAGKVDMDKLSGPDIKELVHYLLMEVDYLRNK